MDSIQNIKQQLDKRSAELREYAAEKAMGAHDGAQQLGIGAALGYAAQKPNLERIADALTRIANILEHRT